MKRTAALKAILARREAILFPGAANGLFARVIEDIGFEAIYVTGAGIANMYLGVPDIGLTTLSEIASHVDAIGDVVNLPLLVDADTGFGNALNMMRTVRVLERAGAAGIQIEDQVFPKKCGHFDGKYVISLDEMLSKVKAAVDARRDQDFQIVARTDARAVLGIDAAIDRAHAMIEAGADVTFVEVAGSEAEMARIAKELAGAADRQHRPWRKTPDLGRERLAEMGFAGVLYANAALQAALRASYEVLAALRKDGSLKNVGNRLAGFDERQRVVAKDKFDNLEKRYSAGAFAPRSELTR